MFVFFKFYSRLVICENNHWTLSIYISVTAYPMWLVMTGCERKGKPMQYVRAIIVPWAGNFLGALFSAFVFSYSTGVLTEEPYRSGIVAQITVNIVQQQWLIIFVRAIGCGFLVRVLDMVVHFRPRKLRSLLRSHFRCSSARNSWTACRRL